MEKGNKKMRECVNVKMWKREQGIREQGGKQENVRMWKCENGEIGMR